ncbi:DUF6385 domain-containing protein [Sporomusa malonica]|uniref:DUF6385 domain-containing protein n=1 Tax=Sporomusa malonica TaxID=112901 RepID=A0A1W2F852_9FIRM|nr:DUF6385 domain-containing protein [Sporomusa malonica]SMD18127.1 hypothetical protein SAMN04488500_1572 [Sporomusa malonica]
MPSKYIKPPLIDAYITCNRTVARTMKRGYLLVGGHTNCYYESIALWDLTSIPADLKITSARANFFIAYNNPSCSKVIEAYPIVSRWKPTSTSLRHPPLTSPNPVATTAISDTAEQLSFEITKLIKEWQSSESANFGLLFRMHEPIYPSNSVSLFSGNYCDSSYWPFIQISYNPPDIVPCICKPDILNVSDIVHTTAAWSYTTPLDVLPYNYSYTISNIGTNPAIICLNVSADSHYWMDQSALHIISPSESTALAPDTITRYACVAFCSLNSGHDTTLNISTQGRTTM